MMRRIRESFGGYRVIGTVAVVVFIGVGLLGLDLLNRGLAWQTFYSLTGEESPPAQLVGMLEWSGRWFRTLPETAPLTPVNHAHENPFGINVFLEQEVEVEKREQILEMVADAGFVWLRQEFPWEDIEIHGRGDFMDRRNDLDGDGEVDEISAWEKYDNIVDLVEEYDLRLQVRLSNPPSWTHSNPEIGDKAPPDDLRDYINYATAVAERYQGRIHYYQVWNEPNIFPEWGNQDADPEGYTVMLCETYDALKAVDPEITVVSGAMAPTVAMGGRNLNDYIFLQRMMDAGAGDCFDVLAVQGYGLNSGPTDRRMRPTTVNFSRPMYVRDMLVQNGYPEKAIWISEAAWNPVPEPDEVPDVDARYNFGQVTEEQAARYMPEAYQRTMEEWPWKGVTFYWFFKRAADFERNQSFYYFRMVEPDFTPLPVYDSMREYTQNLTPTLYEGVHQAEHWAVDLPQDAVQLMVAGAQFEEAVETPRAAFVAEGTHLAVRWQGAISVQIGDQQAVTLETTGDDWQEAQLDMSRIARPHMVSITSVEGMRLDAITVYDRTVRDVLLIAVPALLVVVFVGSGLILVARQQRA